MKTTIVFEILAELKDYENKQELDGLIQTFQLHLRDIYFTTANGTGHTITAVAKREQ